MPIQLTPITNYEEPFAGGCWLTDEIAEVVRVTTAHYSRRGFVAPWISYLALCDAKPVGICSFKSEPVNGRVEIAYFTFPEHEGRGLATAMTAELIGIARRRDPALVVAAQTLVDRDASHRVLEKSGFRCIGTVEHPEDGTVLEWRLEPNTARTGDD